MIELQPAARELAALGAAARGWDYDDLLNAIIAAKNAGWEFGQVYREVTRLILVSDATPASLRHAARTPLREADKPGPTTYDDGAALARRGLEHRNDDAGSAA